MGRGTRIFPGKENCLVLDFAGNLERLGGIAMMEEFIVEEGGKKVGTRQAKPKPKEKQEKKKSNTLQAFDPMAGKAGMILVSVDHVDYLLIGSRTHPGKSLVMVSYGCRTQEGYTLNASEFLCCEYHGYARETAQRWAYARGFNKEIPIYAHALRHLCYSLPSPRQLQVNRNGKYWNVKAAYF
jgi:DNA repair protein RadD